MLAGTSGVKRGVKQMLEDIRLNEFPKESGVYKIIWFGAVIYVGSSNDLHKRMKYHRHLIKHCQNGSFKKGFYLFLQNNPFTVQFELTENYRQKEQELIDYYEPIFNEIKSYTGLSREEYIKQYRESHKEELKQYYESHKEELKQYKKQHDNQKCNYNGEVLTLRALALRFLRQGIKHSTLEAKKYLIPTN